MKHFRSQILIISIGVCALLIVAYSWSLWPFNGSIWTNDAFVHGDITIISPKIAGYVDEIMVKSKRTD